MFLLSYNLKISEPIDLEISQCFILADIHVYVNEVQMYVNVYVTTISDKIRSERF